MRTLLCTVTLMLVGAPGAVQADHVNYAEQARIVSASASAESEYDQNQDSREERAPDYGDFDAAVGAEVTLRYAAAWAEASQTSTFEHGSLRADGSVSSYGYVVPVIGRSGEGTAVSSFSVRFGLAAPTEYTIRAKLDATGGAHAALLVTRYDAPVLEYSPASGDSLVIEESGTFEPGVYLYRIEVRSDANAVVYSEEDSGTFSMSFALDHIVPVDAVSMGELKGGFIDP
jgi:hypothetical protein